MYGKILITCSLTVRTGLHIGGSGIFSPIGAVDSPVVREPLSRRPIVPGSSLKGKLRTLLVRCNVNSKGKGIEDMPEFHEDPEPILRLFGSARPVRRARLQFSDCFITNAEQMGEVGLTEIKTENTIRRSDSVANPRQIERVNAGVQFGVKITYDIIKPDMKEIIGDLELLANGMKLLQLDYLGGHGSRGSGRVSFEGFSVKYYGEDQKGKGMEDELQALFKEVEHYEPFSVSAPV